MKLTLKNKLLFILCLLSLISLTGNNADAQKRKPKSSKKTVVKATKPVDTIAVEVRGGGIGSYKREPSLILEPCAKETPEQISELENAPDKNSQVEILLKRIDEKDDWLRACSIYRLGEFKREAQIALPVVIKLLRDEKNNEVWGHVEDALWKIPPSADEPFAKRLELARDSNVYLRIYGIYSLGYFKLPAGSFQSKDALKTLIEAVKDEDTTASWLAVMSIRQLGFYGIDTSDAIPALSEAITNGKINPINPVRAFVPMGENALPAAPLLMDILQNPKKYAGEKDEDNNRSSVLYLTTAIALGKIGKPLLPLLEKEIESNPFAVMQILGNLNADGTLPILYKAMKNENPKVRKKAIESFPSLSSIGAVGALPHLLEAIKDEDLEVRQEAMSKVGSIMKFTSDKTVEFKPMYVRQVLPILIENLKNKETDCYAAMTIGDFGADGEIAIPKLVNLIKKNDGDYCAEIALFDIGEKGQKFLTAEQLKRAEENRKNNQNLFERMDYNNAKPIKPKVQPTPPKADTLN